MQNALMSESVILVPCCLNSLIYVSEIWGLLGLISFLPDEILFYFKHLQLSYLLKIKSCG